MGWQQSEDGVVQNVQHRVGGMRKCDIVTVRVEV